PKIKAGAVNAAKLANGSVTEAKLASGSVTEAKLASGSVTAAKIADGAVGGAKVDASSLGQVPSGQRAQTATFPDGPNRIAFAKVEGSGQVDATFSKGISSANVSEGNEPGIYCVSAPGITPRGAQVSPQGVFSPATITALVTVGGTGSCP